MRKTIVDHCGFQRGGMQSLAFMTQFPALEVKFRKEKLDQSWDGNLDGLRSATPSSRKERKAVKFAKIMHDSSRRAESKVKVLIRWRG